MHLSTVPPRWMCGMLWKCQVAEHFLSSCETGFLTRVPSAVPSRITGDNLPFFVHLVHSGTGNLTQLLTYSQHKRKCLNNWTLILKAILSLRINDESTHSIHDCWILCIYYFIVLLSPFIDDDTVLRWLG